jgi:hypothetical protein
MFMIMNLANERGPGLFYDPDSPCFEPCLRMTRHQVPLLSFFIKTHLDTLFYKPFTQFSRLSLL